eukprot:15024859-Alexandrium_andersonii.AAC.1
MCIRDREVRRAAIHTPGPIPRPAWMTATPERQREWTDGEGMAYSFHYALRWASRPEVDERLR